MQTVTTQRSTHGSKATRDPKLLTKRPRSQDGARGVLFIYDKTCSRRADLKLFTNRECSGGSAGVDDGVLA